MGRNRNNSFFLLGVGCGVGEWIKLIWVLDLVQKLSAFGLSKLTER